MTFGNILASGRRAAVVLVLALAAVGAGAAQPLQPAAPRQPPATPPKPQPAAPKQKQPEGPPNALQGFSQNRNKPVKINADELEVHDKDKVAVFSGDVHLVQGDTDMRSSKLVVYYDDQPPPPAPPPASGKPAAASAQITPQQNQQIKRVEAKGGVMVIQKDQIANGDEGIFDMRANTVTMQGHVVISQGPNTIRGERLVVNMTTGDAAMHAGQTCEKPPCTRVQGVFTPGSGKGLIGPVPGPSAGATPTSAQTPGANRKPNDRRGDAQP